MQIFLGCSFCGFFREREIRIIFFDKTDKAHCMGGYLKTSYCCAKMLGVFLLAHKIPVHFPETAVCRELLREGLF